LSVSEYWVPEGEVFERELREHRGVSARLDGGPAGSGIALAAMLGLLLWSLIVLAAVELL